MLLSRFASMLRTFPLFSSARISNHEPLWFRRANQTSLPGLFLASVLLFSSASISLAQSDIDHDAALRNYWEEQTRLIEQRTTAHLASPEKYQKEQEADREKLADMLGLNPMPEKTPLQVEVTGTVEEDDFIVQNLHFQASPGLYVTANLYKPKEIEEPLPAVLYVCGHANVRKGNISYGNKVGYHHHGIWFARNGYICLTIDTIQLGEFKGIHHGTYREGMWWWNARGYTPAGVEAWNGIRGIDYLTSRPDVDAERIGVTGRSGGGIYSWWVAALDKRIKAAVPVAGITSMRNHVVDGCIEGHCDCMFQINTYGWDYPRVAALVAPRPLLISNTDKDRIFPLDGVMDVYWQTRRVYEGFDAGENLGIAIAEGPHRDTQRLRVNAFEWFDRHLKDVERTIQPTEKLFEPEQLRVFHDLPEDERTSTIHNTFVPMADTPDIASAAQWETYAEDVKKQLLRKTFRNWPKFSHLSFPTPLKVVEESEEEGVSTTLYHFHTQSSVPLTMTVTESTDLDRSQPVEVQFHLLGEGDKANEVPAPQKPQQIVVHFYPRGVGPHAWKGDERKQTHIRRRFALLGQSLDAMRLWDTFKAIQALRTMPGLGEAKLELVSSGESAVHLLYIPFLLDVPPRQLTLKDLPASHMEGPIYLNVLRVLDIPRTIALAARHVPIRLTSDEKEILDFYRQVSEIDQSELHPVKMIGENNLSWFSLPDFEENLSEVAPPVAFDHNELIMKTLGGSQYWSDIHFFREYRIQRNVFTQHCRLLDQRNYRHASGTYEECLAKLNQLKEQKRLEPMEGEAVVLLHGILRSANSFGPLKKALEKDGYYVFAANYPSTQMTIEEAARDLQRILTSLEGLEKIHLVGHSMGGLVIRAWFALPESDEFARKHLGKIVMLGTPNQGAELADFLDRFPPYHWLFGKAGRQLQTEHEIIKQLPIPSVPFGIIAGGRGEGTNGYNPLITGDDDGTVTVSSTQLKGALDFCVFPCLHMFLMRDPRTIVAVHNFLTRNSFQAEKDEQTAR